MNEEYLEWLFLREHIKDWLGSSNRNDTYTFHSNRYDIQKMQERYIELTQELLLEYELGMSYE